MKKFFIEAGIAVGYFGIYMMGQFAVTYAAMFYWGFKLSMEYIVAGNGMLSSEVLLEKLTDSVNANAITLTLIAGIVSLALLAFSFLVRKKNFLHGVGCYEIPPRSLLLPALLGMTCYQVTSYMVSYVPFPESWMESYLSSSSLISAGNPVIEVLATVLMAPLLEEIVFRGLFYGHLRRVMPKWIAAILASALFGAMHGTIVWFIYTFLLSMAMILVFEKYGSLLTAICLHAVFNLCGTVSSFLPESLWESYDALPSIIHIVIAAACLIATAGFMYIVCRRLKPSDLAKRPVEPFSVMPEQQIQ